MECQKTQILRLTDKNGNACDAWMVFGEVTGVHIDKAMLKNGIYQTALAEPLLRGGGPGDYFTVTEAQKSVMMRPD